MAKAWKNPTRPITLEELAAHNKRRSCWIAINGQVYDVTRYITKHPAGDLILKGAGQDATSLFTWASKYGHSHSEAATAMLAQYHIGELISVN